MSAACALAYPAAQRIVAVDHIVQQEGVAWEGLHGPFHERQTVLRFHIHQHAFGQHQGWHGGVNTGLCQYIVQLVDVSEVGGQQAVIVAAHPSPIRIDLRLFSQHPHHVFAPTYDGGFLRRRLVEVDLDIFVHVHSILLQHEVGRIVSRAERDHLSLLSSLFTLVLVQERTHDPLQQVHACEVPSIDEWRSRHDAAHEVLCERILQVSTCYAGRLARTCVVVGATHGQVRARMSTTSTFRFHVHSFGCTFVPRGRIRRLFLAEEVGSLRFHSCLDLFALPTRLSHWFERERDGFERERWTPSVRKGGDGRVGKGEGWVGKGRDVPEGKEVEGGGREPRCGSRNVVTWL
eukprot:scaffold177_cov334-Pavlova_lutheri.AAC.36